MKPSVSVRAPNAVAAMRRCAYQSASTSASLSETATISGGLPILR